MIRAFEGAGRHDRTLRMPFRRGFGAAIAETHGSASVPARVSCRHRRFGGPRRSQAAQRTEDCRYGRVGDEWPAGPIGGPGPGVEPPSRLRRSRGGPTRRWVARPRTSIQTIADPGSGDPPRSDSAASRAGTGYAAEKVESSDRTMPRVAGLDRRTRRRWTVAGVPSRCRREACAPSPIAFSADQRITCSTRRSSDWNSTATTAPASARRNTRSMTPRAGVTTATSSSGRHAGWSTRRNASTIQAWARSRTGMPAPGTIRTDRSAPRASAILARVGSRGSRDPDSRRPTVTGWTCAARATAAVARPASSRSVRTSRPSPLRISALRRADRISTELLPLTPIVKRVPITSVSTRPGTPPRQRRPERQCSMRSGRTPRCRLFSVQARRPERQCSMRSSSIERSRGDLIFDCFAPNLRPIRQYIHAFTVLERC